MKVKKHFAWAVQCAGPNYDKILIPTQPRKGLAEIFLEFVVCVEDFMVLRILLFSIDVVMGRMEAPGTVAKPL